MLVLVTTGCAKKPERKSHEPPLVTICRPRVEDVPITYNNVGHVVALNTVEVKNQVPGVITNIFYEQGQPVKKGDLMVTIFPDPFVAEYERILALLNQSKSRRDLAKITLERNLTLLKKEYVSQETIDQLTTELNLEEEAIRENTANLDKAKVDVDYCFIYAPWDGIAGLREVDVGNYVTQAGTTTLVTVNQVTPIFINFFLIERLLPIVQRTQMKGPMDVIVRLEGLPNETFTAKLDFIDNLVNEVTGMIQLRAVYENKDLDLWPGEYCTISLVLYTEKDAMLLPSEAVMDGAKGKYVYRVSHDNEIEMVPVEVGHRIGDDLIISKGIKPKDRIVREGQINIRKGTIVEVAGS